MNCNFFFSLPLFKCNWNLL